jgi:hypothetical protein
MASTLRTVDDSMSVQTTDATQTTSVTRTANTNCIGNLAVRVLARQPSSGAVKAWTMTVSYRRSSGDAEIIGVTDTVDVATGAMPWLVVLDTSGSAVRVRLTGAASTTIEWFVRIAGDELEAT